MTCWLGELSMVDRNAVTCVRNSWLSLACTLQKCMDVKSMTVCESDAGCRSLARTVRACHACFAVCVPGENEMV